MFGQRHNPTDWFFDAIDYLDEDVLQELKIYESLDDKLFDDSDTVVHRAEVNDVLIVSKNETMLSEDFLETLSLKIFEACLPINIKEKRIKLLIDIIRLGKYGSHYVEPSNAYGYMDITIGGGVPTMYLERQESYNDFRLLTNRLYVIKNVNGSSHRIVNNGKNNSTILSIKLRRD